MLTEEERMAVAAILDENMKRRAEIEKKFNPVTGEGSTFSESRKHIVIEDFPFKEQWVPEKMCSVPLVKKLVKAGSIKKFITDVLKSEYNDREKE